MSTEHEYGLQLPTMEELWDAQAAPYDAHEAGCDNATYDRLVADRQATEAAFLAGHDRQIAAEIETEEAPAG